MTKRAKMATVGMKIEAKRKGCKPSELGEGSLAEARRVDAVVQRAFRDGVFVGSCMGIRQDWRVNKSDKQLVKLAVKYGVNLEA